MPKVPATWKDYARITNRMRWKRKWDIARANEGRASFAERVRYVATNPELDTFSYELANSDELAEQLADYWSLPAATVVGYCHELINDRGFAARIRSVTAFDPALLTSPPLGRQVTSYAIARILSPKVTVEVGSRYGLGTAVLLRAMERNKHGRLVTVDIDPCAGRIARRLQPPAPRCGPIHTPTWTFVPGASPDALEAGPIEGVGFAILDAVPVPEVTRQEIDIIRDNATGEVTILQSGWNFTLPDVCSDLGIPTITVTDQPTEHVGAGRTSFIARMPPL